MSTDMMSTSMRCASDKTRSGVWLGTEVSPKLGLLAMADAEFLDIVALMQIEGHWVSDDRRMAFRDGDPARWGLVA